MSRTKRIYNSYEKYGRFFPKRAFYWEFTNGRYVRSPPKPFRIKTQDDRRYTIYGHRYMGYRRSKHIDKRRKRNKKIKILKFETISMM